MLRLAIALLFSVLVGVPSRALAATLRPGHPRIWLSSVGERGITPATVQTRCLSATTAYGRACREATPIPVAGTMPVGTSPQPLISLALRYVMFQEPALLPVIRQVIMQIGPFVDRGDPNGQIVGYASAVRQLAVAYDWLYDSLQPADRTQLETYLRGYANWYITQEPTDVFSAEAYAQAATVGLVGLALGTGAGDAGTDTDALRYRTYAETRWKTVLLPALAYTQDWWPEGPGRFNTVTAVNTLYFTTAWSTGTDEDLFAWARDHGDPFQGFIQYEAYALRPDFRYAAFGDSTDADLSPAQNARPVLDMLSWGTGSTVAQGLALEVTRRVPAARDYNGTEAWHQVVFFDPARPNQPDRTTLPTARHLSAGAQDVAVMQSGWQDSDTWLSLSCGDWFTTHQHDEVGSIQLFRRAPLVVSTGYYDGVGSLHWTDWYAQHSIHASTVAVLQPGEMFPNDRLFANFNEGGQRPTFTLSGRRTLDEYRSNLTAGPNFDTGGITAFESALFHDYAACDATRAYNSHAFALPMDTPKVTEVTRQVVFLRPQLVVVFDRVEATDPTYVKRVQWHSLVRPVLTDDTTWVMSTGTGRMVGRTMLPAHPTRTLVTGFTLNGMAVPPTLTGQEASGVRLEIASANPVARDYFLHVLDATDPTADTLPPTTLLDDGDNVGVRVGDPASGRVFSVSFHRTGALGGSITVTTTDGTMLFQGDLGANGTFYPPVTDGGVPSGTGDASTADALDGTGLAPPRTPAGCTCRATSPRGAGDSVGWLWAVGLMLAVRTRRTPRN